MITYAHNSRLHIDGKGTKTYKTAAEYEQAVKLVLDRVHGTATGKALMTEMFHRTKRALKIVPYEQKALNAYASADDLKAATLKGHVERSGKDGHVLKDGHNHSIVGTGTGSNVTLSFTPLIYAKFCKANKAHKSGSKPEEVLCHEMTHAVRQMRGVLDTAPLGYLYDTEEEFFAILVANIYASERGFTTDIRSDHHGHEPISKNQDTNAEFLPKIDPTDYKYQLIDKFVKEEPKFAAALAAVAKAKFNPIRRYFELQKAAKAHAHPKAPVHKPAHAGAK